MEAVANKIKKSRAREPASVFEAGLKACQKKVLKSGTFFFAPDGENGVYIYYMEGDVNLFDEIAAWWVANGYAHCRMVTYRRGMLRRLKSGCERNNLAGRIIGYVIEIGASGQ